MENVENKALDNHPENCKIYTPGTIAIRMLKHLDIKWNSKFKILEPAVGNGNIFLELITIFLEEFNGSKIELRYKLENNFTAFDIDENALKALVKSLNRLVYIKTGIEDIKWNISVLNILEFDKSVSFIGGFDYIICNPPYIHVRELNNEQRKILKSISTCEKGNINLYYLFLDMAAKWLKPNGKFSYIVPNGILNNKSGNKLREYLLDMGSITKIENYSNDEIFKNALVKTCIICFEKNKNNISTEFIEMEYKNHTCRIISSQSVELDSENYMPQITQLKTGHRLKELFHIEGGIATFEDKFFIIKKEEILDIESVEYIFFRKDDQDFFVERDILRKVIRPSKEKEDNYIIFPYQNQNGLNPIELDKFPAFNNYYTLFKKKESYTYGRRQSISYIDNERIILPKICKDFKMQKNINCLVVSGISLILKPEYMKKRDMIYDVLERNLDRLFLEATNKSKAYGSGYYNISTNALKELYIELEDKWKK